MTPALTHLHTNSLNQNWLLQDTEEHTDVELYIHSTTQLLHLTFIFFWTFNSRHPHTSNGNTVCSYTSKEKLALSSVTILHAHALWRRSACCGSRTAILRKRREICRQKDYAEEQLMQHHVWQMHVVCSSKDGWRYYIPYQSGGSMSVFV